MMKRFGPAAAVLLLPFVGGPLLAQTGSTVGVGDSISVGGVSASGVETAGSSGGRGGGAGTSGFAGSVSAGGFSASDADTAGASAAGGRAGSSFANGSSVTDAGHKDVGQFLDSGAISSPAIKRPR